MGRRSAPTRSSGTSSLSPVGAGGRGEGKDLNRILTNKKSVHLTKLSSLARAFLDELGLTAVELSLSLVTDAEIRRLNREWRSLDRPTDVLSFPAGDSPAPGLLPLGDVIISLDTARRAAKTFRSTLERELALYLAHGLLHLLGHDHHTRTAARRMEREERRLLGHAGMLSRSDEL
ncbi:MAG: rRNA maturation RNase YbeY [Myxococcales bacterium]|nr:rRNA maturation RNase YbeY [Myxococcales bacterium]